MRNVFICIGHNKIVYNAETKYLDMYIDKLIFIEKEGTFCHDDARQFLDKKYVSERRCSFYLLSCMFAYGCSSNCHNTNVR